MTPLLLPELATGASGELESLRTAAVEAVRWACEGASRIAILAPGHVEDQGPTWSLDGFGRTIGDGPAVELPVAVGRWLLLGTPAVAVGSDTLEPQDFDALLVMGDGSASRTEKAPRHLDDRAVPFDDRVLAAVEQGEPEELAGLDLALAESVAAAGAPAWKRLGQRLQRVVSAQVDAVDDRYGVLYFVARWIAVPAGRA
jgi:hypothetical protein